MSKRIPWAFSSFASVAQSLQTMQWVRLVAGFLTLGHAAAKRESWRGQIVLERLRA